MSVRILLYAEGPGEDRGQIGWLPEPGEPLLPEMLGPAHHLFSRVLASELSAPETAIQFLSPFRLDGSRPHRGSDLLVRRNLRRLLTIAAPSRRPDLAIVLVDEDGQGDRRASLLRSTEGIELPHVIAIAIREFEAWLIADHAAIVALLGPRPTPPAYEAMEPGHAKSLLQQWAADAHRDLPEFAAATRWEQIRSHLARIARLDALDRLPSFARLRSDLRSAFAKRR